MLEGLGCPKCGCIRSTVIGKKNILDGIYRRRECEKCGERYTSYEFNNDMVKRIKARAYDMGLKEGRMKTDVGISPGD